MKTEFDLIHYIKKSFGLRAIGDDCAILPKDAVFDMVVTADLLVEDIDFRLELTKPEFLGHKALAVSLSDIAAMGATPAWAMLSLGVAENLWKTDFIERFYDGWYALAAEFDIELVGGDLSRSPDKFLVDSIAGGNVAKDKAIKRSGANPGDAIFVTGRLGGAASGLRLLQQGTQNSSDKWRSALIDRQLRPTPRVETGKFLLEFGLATAMIDISDGLSSDLHHICEASRVGAEIDASLLPVDEQLKNICDANEALTLALNGGEDFELLFTAPSDRVSDLDPAEFTRIGTVTEDTGVVKLKDGDKLIDLRPSGYRHF